MPSPKGDAFRNLHRPHRKKVIVKYSKRKRRDDERDEREREKEGQLFSDVKSTRVSYIRCCLRERASVALDSSTIEISAKQAKQEKILCVIGK